MSFVHADAPSLIHQKLCNAVWKINTRVILSWCFGRFLKRFLLSIKFTFCISGRMISDFCLLSVNHDSKPNNFRYKSTSFEQIRFIWKAGPYGIDFLLTGLWHDVACKYWCVSVDFVNKLVIKLHSLSFFDINTSLKKINLFLAILHGKFYRRSTLFRNPKNSFKLSSPSVHMQKVSSKYRNQR